MLKRLEVKFMKKLLKKASAFIITATMMMSMLSLVSVSTVSAAAGDSFWGGSGASGTAAQAGLGIKDPRVVMAGIINTALGFLGIIAVVMILLGGFKYMTAAGAEEKIKDAKKIIIAGIIGLVIILSAFGIASFVISNLATATQ